MESMFERTRELLHSLAEALYCLQNSGDTDVFVSLAALMDGTQEYRALLKGNGLGYEAEGIGLIVQMVSKAIEIQNKKQAIALLHKELIPFLCGLQGSVFGEADGILRDYWGKNRLVLRKKDRGLYHAILSARDDISDDYQLLWARTGDLVLTVQTGNGMVRLNSSGDPWQEALLFVKGELQEQKAECVVVGFGLGYHIELLAKQPGIEKITVLENDLTQLAIAFGYRDLSGVLSDKRISVLYCPGPEEYLKWLDGDENRICSIWYPSIKTIQEKALRESLENFWIENSSVKKMGQTLEGNFARNVEKKDEEVSALKERFHNKIMVLVAAGPSLEDSFGQLEALDRSKSILVCVGKVARRLIQAGIIPDYIIMTDGLAGTVWQVRGIEDCMVPLIYLSTVAADVIDAYQGKRYIAFQEGFPTAERHAEQNGYMLYQSGGSVATFAIDLGIRLECSRIICVGLDMGYLDKRSHAFGIGASVADNKNLRKTEGISSDYIYTSKTLDIYRKWIERRINGVKHVEFINASKGARIHGMEEKDLKDCFSDIG
ncbi:MAG: motility associated factor glycosyltransferase family protein [Lachnospiraceae bacterium]|nr:motility associated factor glycosyltransferase family protein [Lachnospiraceae bacterium]